MFNLENGLIKIVLNNGVHDVFSMYIFQIKSLSAEVLYFIYLIVKRNFSGVTFDASEIGEPF